MKTQSITQKIPRDKTSIQTYQTLWYVLGTIEVLLGLRVVLQTVGANPLNPFVNMIYALGNPFALLFQGVLIAMLTYFVVVFGIVEYLKFAHAANANEAMAKIYCV